MLKWVQSGLSSVAGTAEPEYGREAIHTIVDFINKGDAVSRDTTREDLAWQHPDFTNVETQTFYFTDLERGYVGFAQVIHSNIFKSTAQFTFRLYNNKSSGPDANLIWNSTALENFRTDGPNFYADNFSIELTGDGDNTFTFKFTAAQGLKVELVATRLVPGVIFGKDGKTLYGEDVAEPWGSMRHLFWPRCSVVGTIEHNDASYSIEGYTMFVMALQGMKPHHAAKSWNFLNFQSENFSAVQMEFTTPRSYAYTKVNIAILTSKDSIIATSIDNDIVHENPELDDVGWAVPKSILFNFTDGTDTTKIASVSGALKNLVERVDVMSEMPQFVKNIVSGVVGAKPYIYQFCNPMTITYGDKTEEGVAFNEATFISE